VHSLVTTTPMGDWHSVAVCSDGRYGVEKGVISSFPISRGGGTWEIVPNVPINPFSRAKIDASVKELAEERSLVAELLPK
jgi:malate dehydrogenase